MKRELERGKICSDVLFSVGFFFFCWDFQSALKKCGAHKCEPGALLKFLCMIHTGFYNHQSKNPVGHGSHAFMQYCNNFINNNLNSIKSSTKKVTPSYLCRIKPTDSAHFLVVGGMSGWEDPVVTSTTQVPLDSRSDAGREPSSKSWLLPPPKPMAWLKRFIWGEGKPL